MLSWIILLISCHNIFHKIYRRIPFPFIPLFFGTNNNFLQLIVGRSHLYLQSRITPRRKFYGFLNITDSRNNNFSRCWRTFQHKSTVIITPCTCSRTFYIHRSIGNRFSGNRIGHISRHGLLRLYRYTEQQKKQRNQIRANIITKRWKTKTSKPI